MVDIGRALWNEILSDHVMMTAAGLGFYAVFGLLPALAAAAAIWGQVAGFGSLSQSIGSGNDVLPHDLVNVLRQFVTSVPEGFGGGLGLALNLALVVVTSYRAAGGLLTALNIVYDVQESRGRVRRGVAALLVGVCGIVSLFATLALMALPLLLAPYVGNAAAIWLVWLRWPALALTSILGLSLIFRYAPSRGVARWRWIVAAAATATALWVAASLGVSLYAAHIASLGRFYGSLASVAVVLLWFYASAVAILAGAEIDGVLSARAEHRPMSRLKSDLRRRERSGSEGIGSG